MVALSEITDITSHQ